MDILCHALESLTARPYTAFERKRPEQRVPYCGANPIADMWAEKALSLLAGSFRRAVRDGEDEEARGEMAMAATFAGMGFGNAGVHIPHANAYPIAGRVKDFHPEDYPADHPMIPHGMSVSLTAPEAFRFTFDASPDRHRRAAQLLDPHAEEPDDAAEFLPAVLTALMRDIGIPDGIGAVGYGEGDIGDLVEGTLKQQRLLATAPKQVTGEDLEGIFRRSITLWLPPGAVRHRRTASCRRRCAGPASGTSTPPAWPGRCTPATPRSTGCCPGPSSARGTPTRSSRRWRSAGSSAFRSPRAGRAPRSPGTRSARASCSTPAGTCPGCARSTRRPGRRWSIPASSRPRCRPRAGRTGCVSAPTRAPPTAARSAG
jgi:hypothetical protein